VLPFTAVICCSRYSGRNGNNFEAGEGLTKC